MQMLMLIGFLTFLLVAVISGFTALMGASLEGHTEIVKALLGKGADVNEKNNDNRTALDYAKVMGHEEIVNLLLQKTGR